MTPSSEQQGHRYAMFTVCTAKLSLQPMVNTIYIYTSYTSYIYKDDNISGTGEFVYKGVALSRCVDGCNCFKGPAAGRPSRLAIHFQHSLFTQARSFSHRNPPHPIFRCPCFCGAARGSLRGNQASGRRRSVRAQIHPLTTVVVVRSLRIVSISHNTPGIL